MKLSGNKQRQRRKITIRTMDFVWFTIVVFLASFQLTNLHRNASESSSKRKGASFPVKTNLSARSLSQESDGASNQVEEAVTISNVDAAVEKQSKKTASKPAAGAPADGQQAKGEPAEGGKEIDKKKPYPYVPGTNYSEISGCLYIMDDNHYLIEWLAYNYQVLPMRNLYVAVDPKSVTSPTPIFDRYRKRGLMNITEWTDDVFYLHDVDPTVDVNNFKDEADQMVQRHRYRQHCFYLQCMKAHKQAGRAWTAILDTDEFLLVNQDAKGLFSVYNALKDVPGIKLPPRKQDPQIKDKSAAKINDPSYQEDSTLLDILKSSRAKKELNEIYRQRMVESPCLMISRVRFSPKESPMSKVNDPDLIPPGFNATSFLSQRWRWHNGLNNLPLNRLGKAIVDVSRIPDKELFINNVYVHRPIMSACFHIKQANFRSTFVGHHYMGTYEQWSFRDDPRKWTRGARDEYELLKIGTDTDDSARGWLRDFVHNVGNDTAMALLADVGYVPPKEDVYGTKQA